MSAFCAFTLECKTLPILSIGAVKFVCTDEMQGPGWTNRRVDFGRFIPTFCKVNGLDFVPAAAQGTGRRKTHGQLLPSARFLVAEGTWGASCAG